MSNRDRLTARRAVLAALLAMVAAGPALAAGANVHAAEKAVEARLPKGDRAFFSAVFETGAAVCGVVTDSNGDARFVATLAAAAKGRRSVGEVAIEAPDGPMGTDVHGAPTSLFDLKWNAECASD